MDVFKLRMYPAADGDCLMLTWGNGTSHRHALVDFGRAQSYRAARARLHQIGTFELCVITHIDADHIAGAVTFFNEGNLPFTGRQIWFNGHRQLQAAWARKRPLAPLSVAQAEQVSAAIEGNGWNWNTHFASSVVSSDSPEAKKAMQIEGGLQLTLLSPDDDALIALLPVWERHLQSERLRIGDAEPGENALPDGLVVLGLDVDEIARARFEEDDAIANGTSIAFLAEFAGKRILMAGDAHPGVIVNKLVARGFSEDNRLELHCLKVSHHGSKSNTSPELLRLIDCTCFAFSTDGSRRGHPDRETIAWILKNDPHRPKTLVYNYPQTEATNNWLDPTTMKDLNYVCAFPEGDDGGIELDIG